MTSDLDRRKFIAASAAATAGMTLPGLMPAGLTPGVAWAQDAYPSRSISIISPFPPGGATDVVTRPLAAALEPVVKQAVVLETKPGAAGAVGAQVAAAAKPDGYTLLSHLPSLSGFATVDQLFGRAPKFTNADFIPIARIIADPCVLIVNDNYTSDFNLNSDPISNITGTIYSPTVTLAIDGSETAGNSSPWTILAAKKLKLIHSPLLVINANYGGTDVPVPDYQVGNKTNGSRLTN